MRVLVTGGAGFIGAQPLPARWRPGPRSSEVVALDDLSTGDAGQPRRRRGRAGDGRASWTATLLARARGRRRRRGPPGRPPVGAPVAGRPGGQPRRQRDRHAPRPGGLPPASAARGRGLLVLGVRRRRRTCPSTRTCRPGRSARTGRASSPPRHTSWPTRHSFGLPVLPLRFFNVYGPLQSAGHAYAAVIPAFVHAALRGEPVPVHGDGRQTRDFTFVGTVSRSSPTRSLGRVTRTSR